MRGSGGRTWRRGFVSDGGDVGLEHSIIAAGAFEAPDAVAGPAPAGRPGLSWRDRAWVAVHAAYHVGMADRPTHVSEEGTARMVDVGEKTVTRRRAVASARVVMQPQTLASALAGRGPKGPVVEVARLAGIQGAKRTADLVPLCHPLPLDAIDVVIEPVGADALGIRATVATTWKTGVEMEALTAAAVAALTVIDMGKAVDRTMVIESVRLLEKTGGRSGHFIADKPPADKRND